MTEAKKAEPVPTAKAPDTNSTEAAAVAAAKESKSEAAAVASAAGATNTAKSTVAEPANAGDNKAPDTPEKPQPDLGSGTDAEFEKARNEPESPIPSDDALDALDGLSAGVAQSGEMLQDQQEAERVMKKLTNLALDLLPSTSPDSYTLFGYGGVSVTVGDLRTLGRILRKYQKG